VILLANDRPSAVRAINFLVHDAEDPFVSGDGLDRQASGLPFGVAVLEPADAIAASSERGDGFERKDTVRATAVGNHLSTFCKLTQASFQFGERNVKSAWKMAERELVFGSDIEHRDQIVSQSRDQVVTGYGFERIAGLKVIGHDTADLGNVAFADATERLDQCDDFGFARQAIKHVFAATLGLDEAGPSEDLQVAGGVGKRQMRPSRQILDGPYALGKMLQELKPVSMTERLRHFSEVLVDRLFRSGA
jgi:hypothetical protein